MCFNFVFVFVSKFLCNCFLFLFAKLNVRKFFSEIEKEWTGDKDEEVVKEYIKKDGARRRCAGGDGRKTKKVKTEEEDCEDDEEMEEGSFIISKDTKFTAQQISDVGNKIGIPRPKLKKLVTELNKFHG